MLKRTRDQRSISLERGGRIIGRRSAGDIYSSRGRTPAKTIRLVLGALCRDEKRVKKNNMKKVYSSTPIPKRERLDSLLALLIFLLACALLAIYLSSCAAKVEPPERELELAPLVRMEKFIALGLNTLDIGNMHLIACGTEDGYKFKSSKVTVRRRQRLEDRLNAWYHKALRRLHYLRLNNPIDTRIIITDLFKDVGDPIDAFYQDEMRRPENLQFGEQMLFMSLNEYLEHVIDALGDEEKELKFKMWQESKKEN